MTGTSLASSTGRTCLALALGVTLLLTGCGRAPTGPSPEPDNLAPVASAIRDMTGFRTRLVWLQDIGDGADYLARGANLQLMGYDTDDARGERVILPGGKNMAKPMFTVDGDRIVFTDRHEGTMHLVDWEGGEPDTLGEGFVLHTWRDTKTGIEWLYYAKELVDDGKILPTHEAIYRKGLPPYPRNWATLLTRLRGRLGERRVWTQTQVSEDSYQLSADGRFASASFPWPEVGVHDIGARRWNRHGRGCWVAMAPDNSYLFWIFDGPHRNLTMERIGDPETAGRWTVRINQLPDTDRYEVYHPRWSNHPRIMAVTGPYKVGEGAYRLPGGGGDVEIWLGRFSEDHRAIEHWVRATYNGHADFYPDVWVERDPRMQHAADVPDAPVIEPGTLTWPSDPEALAYLWTHGAEQNEIVDADSGQRHILRPDPRALARYGKRHEMWLKKGYFVDEQPIVVDTEFSMECMIGSPADAVDGAFILGFDPDHALIESEGHWIFRWQQQSFDLGAARHDELLHLVIAVRHDRLHAMVKGATVADIPLTKPLANPPSGLLHFGGHPSAAADWPGTLSHVALYRRVLDQREANLNRRLAMDQIEQQPASAPVSVRARVVEQSSIPTPADIAPYRRALVVNTYEVIDGEQTGDRFLAAHWAILDGVVLDTALRPVGEEIELRIELFDEHPELEGERVAMDSEDFTLELWYDLNL